MGKKHITLQEQVCTLFLITSKQTEQLYITKTKGTNAISKANKQKQQQLKKKKKKNH